MAKPRLEEKEFLNTYSTPMYVFDAGVLKRRVEFFCYRTLSTLLIKRINFDKFYFFVKKEFIFFALCGIMYDV